MDAVILSLTTAAAVGCGLMAGLFLFCSVALMPALARIPAPAAVAAMREVNVAIVRLPFLVVFLGTAVATAALAVLAADAPRLTAAGCYLVGVIGVTALANVPLNDALAGVVVTSADGERFWRHYLARWTAWNHVRTGCATLATLALVVAAP